MSEVCSGAQTFAQLRTGLSLLTTGCLLKNVNKLAKNPPVPVKGRDLTRHQQKMLIAIEGPKLEKTECSAYPYDFCVFCTQFKRQYANLKLICQKQFLINSFFVCVSKVEPTFTVDASFAVTSGLCYPHF